jgi:hypothetical protein
MRSRSADHRRPAAAAGVGAGDCRNRTSVPLLQGPRPVRAPGGERQRHSQWLERGRAMPLVLGATSRVILAHKLPQLRRIYSYSRARSRASAWARLSRRCGSPCGNPQGGLRLSRGK